MPDFIPTPGQYLKLRRRAAGLSIEMLALGLDSVPPVSHRTRVGWLEAIEKDAQPITPGTAILLHKLFRFDPTILDVLLLRAAGRAVEVPPICRGCGCSFHDPCMVGLLGCSWSTGDPSLCTICEVRGAGPADDTDPDEVPPVNDRAAPGAEPQARAA